MPALQLWQEYTRADVHEIFSSTTKFTPQAGTWGLQGMVRIPDRPGDWVFFVTYGGGQGEHVFDESITPDGVLSWQSQPALRFKDTAIQGLVRHDASKNNIHLFLRTEQGTRYVYFGLLGYITHDSSREAPVYFQWQILDWPPPPKLRARIQLSIEGPSYEAADAALLWDKKRADHGPGTRSASEAPRCPDETISDEEIARLCVAGRA
jgi:hypothetical protein